jgi:chemotaxis signal transduction protein
MVCFHAGQVAYCLPIADTRAVRTSAGITKLPDPRPGVAGMIPGTPPMTVLSSLGQGGTHILVVETSTRAFGLLVDEVTSLWKVDDDKIGPIPEGQSQRLVSGTAERDGELLLIVDPDALAALL